jgi:hypothetical protein
MISQLERQIDAEFERKENRERSSRDQIEKQENEKQLEDNEQREQYKFELLYKFQIDPADPIVAVIDFLHERLLKTEKSFEEFKTRFNDSALQKMMAFLEHQSTFIENKKSSFGLLPAAMLIVGVYGLGISSNFIFDQLQSKILHRPVISANHFDNKSTYFLNAGHIDRIAEENGVYRIEVSHVVAKSHSKN